MIRWLLDRPVERAVLDVLRAGQMSAVELTAAVAPRVWYVRALDYPIFSALRTLERAARIVRLDVGDRLLVAGRHFVRYRYQLTGDA